MLRPYMVSDGMPEEGAVLVFAHTAKEARKVGYPEVASWCGDIEWIDIRAVWLKSRPWVSEQVDKTKLDTPHIIESPIYCKSCEQWGLELDKNGHCENCANSKFVG